MQYSFINNSWICCFILFFLQIIKLLSKRMIRKSILNHDFNLSNIFFNLSSWTFNLMKFWSKSLKMSSPAPFTKCQSKTLLSLLSALATKSKPSMNGWTSMALNLSLKSHLTKATSSKTSHWKDWSVKFTKKYPNWKDRWQKKTKLSPIWPMKWLNWRRLCCRRRKRIRRIKSWWNTHLRRQRRSGRFMRGQTMRMKLRWQN